MSDVLNVLTDIENYLIDLPAKIILRADQIFIVNGLSDVSENLGIVTAGEFRAGNRNEPGIFLRTGVAGSGFSGMRMRYPAMSYDLDGVMTDWNLVGINDDILQFGVRASDGKLVAGGGAVILDEDGITAVGGTIAGWTINTDHLLSPNVPGIKIASTGSIETTNFIPGIGGVGWRITKDGDVEFNNAVIRGELRTTVFTYQEVQAVAGTMGVFPSAGVLLETTDMIPSISGSINIKIKDPEYAHAPLFGVDDILRIKDAFRDTWLKVTGVTDSTTYYTYVCTVLSGTTGTTYTTGQAVVSYGVSGDGFLLMEAVGTEAPYFSVRTHAGTPYGAGNEEHVRLGNLNGTPGTSINVYGAYIGDATQYLKYVNGVLTLAGDGSGITSIDGGNITTGYIDADRIAAGSISADKIEANSITSDQLDTSVFRLKALAPSSLTMLCHFDGSQTSGDITFNSTGHMGQVNTIDGSVYGGEGKFGKGATFLSKTNKANYVQNPSFEGTYVSGIAPNWTAYAWGSPAPTGTRYESSDALFGSKCQGIQKTDTNVSARIGISMTAAVATGNLKTTSSVWIKVKSYTDGAQIFFYISGGTSSNYIGYVIQPEDLGVWKRIDISHTDTTSDWKMWLAVRGAPADVLFDGAMIAYDEILYPYFDGSFPGCAWSGTAHASTSTVSTAGKIYIQPENIPTKGTIMFWFKVDEINSTGWVQIFARHNGTNGLIYIYIDTNGKMYNRWGTAGATGSTMLQSGEWYHYALVRENDGTQKAYLNGVLEWNTTAVYPFEPSTSLLQIGGFAGYDNGSIDGVMDEFAIIDRPLSADEIKAIYESDAPLSANTSAWEFRSSNNLIWMDSNGLFVNDISGNNAFGVIAVDNYAWGGFTTTDLDAGDIVIGRNETNSSAIKWDISSGKFGFYGNAGADPQVEIGTDGSLLAGGGNLILDSTGMTLYMEAAWNDPNSITWRLDATTPYDIYAQLSFRSADEHSIYGTLSAINDNTTSGDEAIVRVYAYTKSNQSTLGLEAEYGTAPTAYLQVSNPFESCRLELNVYDAGLTVGSGGSTPNVWYATNSLFQIYTTTKVDGILKLKPNSAPSTDASYGQLYIDSADGDLKVRFGNGTVKTIATN